jgi:hypothetical protein
VFCDNTVAIAYINHMGGNVGWLHRITRQIWDLLESKDAFLTATYVASAANIGDQYTRGFGSPSPRFFDLEVPLNPAVFQSVVMKKGPFVPEFDWFASCFNTQMPRFCAWQEGLKGAELFDAFMHDWSICDGYMFPPFGLLPKVLQKVCANKARVVLIHPDWPVALWRPLLNRELLVPYRSIQKKRCWVESTFTYKNLLHLHRTDAIPSTGNLLRYPTDRNLRRPMKLSLSASWIVGA